MGIFENIRAAFSQIYEIAAKRNLDIFKKVRWKLDNLFLVPEVFNLAHDLYDEKEGKHATPSEIVFTLYRIFAKAIQMAEWDHILYLAKPEHGKLFLKRPPMH